jgi:Cu+-exporting ATPase
MCNVILSCLLMAIALGGCASAPATNGTVAATQPHAECLVCKANADLACIDVAVEADTPRYAYDGRTYYFCSESCRGKFAKNPAKYLGK